MSRAQVLIADPHEPCRRAIADVIERANDGLAVAGETATIETLERMTARLQPHLVLVDLQAAEPAPVITRLRERAPRVRVVVVAGDAGGEAAFEALRAGADGFIPKSADPADVLEALQRVARGEPGIHPALVPDLARRVVEALRSAERGWERLSRLSQRERQVAELITEGVRPCVIAQQLVLSPRTVESHLASLYRKLGVRGRIEAIREYTRLRRVLS